MAHCLIESAGHNDVQSEDLHWRRRADRGCIGRTELCELAPVRWYYLDLSKMVLAGQGPQV